MEKAEKKQQLQTYGRLEERRESMCADRGWVKINKRSCEERGRERRAHVCGREGDARTKKLCVIHVLRR